VRDGVVFGAGYFWTDSLRLYGEVAVAAASGGAEPGEIQFGFEWMQARNTGFRGGPFVAVNCDLRQEVDYNGTFRCNSAGCGESMCVARISASAANT